MSDTQHGSGNSRCLGSNQYLAIVPQGSSDGCEPYEEIAPFQGKTDWQRLDAAFLDAHALHSVSSRSRFRFFCQPISWLTPGSAQVYQCAVSLTGGFPISTLTLSSEIGASP